jgi:hypothetical protein
MKQPARHTKVFWGPLTELAKIHIRGLTRPGLEYLGGVIYASDVPARSRQSSRVRSMGSGSGRSRGEGRNGAFHRLGMVPPI